MGLIIFVLFYFIIFYILYIRCNIIYIRYYDAAKKKKEIVDTSILLTNREPSVLGSIFPFPLSVKSKSIDINNSIEKYNKSVNLLWLIFILGLVITIILDSILH